MKIGARPGQRGHERATARQYRHAASRAGPGAGAAVLRREARPRAGEERPGGLLYRWRVGSSPSSHPRAAVRRAHPDGLGRGRRRSRRRRAPARGVEFEEVDMPGLRPSTGSPTSRATTRARAGRARRLVPRQRGEPPRHGPADRLSRRHAAARRPPGRPPRAPYRQPAARLRLLHAAVRLERRDDPRRHRLLSRSAGARASGAASSSARPSTRCGSPTCRWRTSTRPPSARRSSALRSGSSPATGRRAWRSVLSVPAGGEIALWQSKR